MTRRFEHVVARALVRLAALVVPRTDRDDWEAEWVGELANHPGDRSVSRALGAFRHALWVRRDRSVGARRGGGRVETVWQDVRYGLRRLASSPGFTLVAVTVMGLGIGANTAIFSIVNAMLFRPLPFAQPETLVRVFTTEEMGERAAAVSLPDFRDYRARSDLFDGAVVTTAAVLSLGGEGNPEAVFGEFVSAAFFDVLGVHPIRGRGFAREEEAGSGVPVAVVSHATWERRYGSDPAVIGRTVRLNGHPVTIVGVAPADYSGTFVGIASEFWLPWGTAFAIDPSQRQASEMRTARGLFMIARMGEGVTLPAVREGLTATADALASRYPESNRGRGVVVLPVNEVRLHPMIDSALYPVAGLLTVVVGLVLLVACTNLANLLLVRATARNREIAVRMALGASRSRLVRQLLVESALLGLAGGVAGVVLAHGLANLIVSFRPPIPVPVAIDLRLDGTVLLYALVLAVGTGLAFGLLPALRASRPDVVTALKDDAGGSARRSRRLNLRGMLVTVQVAVSAVLLVAAGLFTRGLGNAQRVDPGFETTQAAIVSFDLELAGYDRAAGQVFYDELATRLDGHPALASTGKADRLPLGPSLQTTEIRVEGYTAGTPTGAEDVDFARVDRGFFDVLGIPILAGSVSELDRPDGPPVAVVSRAAAMRYWGGLDVVGTTARIGRAERVATVVAVVEDVKVRTLGEAPRPHVYLSFAQGDERFVSIVSGVKGEPEQAVEILRRAVTDLDPSIPILEAKTMERHLGFSLFAPRMGAALLGAFSVLAVVLASVGLYGVVAFSAARRTREIGVRMALGARRREVVRLVVGDGAVLVGLGALVGVGGSLLLLQPVSRFLIGVTPTDVATHLAVVLVLGVVALVASWVPAVRASRTDPMVALRYE